MDETDVIEWTEKSMLSSSVPLRTFRLNLCRLGVVDELITETEAAPRDQPIESPIESAEC